MKFIQKIYEEDCSNSVFVNTPNEYIVSNKENVQELHI